MKTDLRRLTEEYIQNFNDKDITSVLSLMSDEFTLKDPGNFIEGKDDCEEFLKDIFSNEISFNALDIFEDGSHSIIHFEITLNEKTLNGVDIIEWAEGKMISLVAYL